MAEHLIDMPEVQKRTGIKSSAIYERIKQGTFPKQLHLRGVRKSLWRASEIEKWVNDQLVG